MKIPGIKRLLVLITLFITAIWVMGSGTSCPPPCVIEGAPCASTCNGIEDWECKNSSGTLVCAPKTGPDAGVPDGGG